MDHGSVNHNFLLASLKTFSSVFCSFNMKRLRCRLFIFLLLGVPWIFWICGLFSVSNKKNSLLSQIFPLFLSLVFWYSNHTCVTHFKIVCSSLLLCSVSFHSIFLHFNLGSFYWLSSNTLICVCKFVLQTHQRHFKLLLQCFRFWVFAFEFLLESPSLCLSYASVLVCCWLFSLKPLKFNHSYFKLSF